MDIATATTIMARYEERFVERLRERRCVLTAEDIHNKSQRQILHLIAERNDGWLVVQPAIRIMVGLRVLSGASASGEIYTLLRQRPKKSPAYFVRAWPGIYRQIHRPLPREDEYQGA